MDLSLRPCWVFDMDGTLTVPVHDFRWLRDQLEIPQDQDILDTIEARPPDRAARDRAFIEAYEDRLALGARAQDDAVVLLERLAGRGATLGILTRNTLHGARVTLQAAGLDRYFPEAHIVGRECAPPKPDPAGVLHLLRAWNARPDQAVVVGDWIHDVRAGARAGTATVLVLRHGRQPWEAEADVVVEDLRKV